MIKEYYKDSYKLEENVKILKLIDIGNNTGVLLDRSIFFPGGGGQAKDIAFLYINSKKYKINDIIKIDGDIYHIIPKIEEGIISKDAVMYVDRINRLDNMHQHTGQHLLSGCFYKLFKRNTLGLHIGKDLSQLDIEGFFTDEMVEKVEEMANNLIYESISIKNYVVEDEIIETRRALPITDEDIRVLEIPNIDINACCGVHAKNTKDLSLIKIKRYYKNKDFTRFEYLAGKRATEYLLRRDRIFEKMLLDFNCSENNILNSIDNLKNKKDEFYSMYKYQSMQFLKNISYSIFNDSLKNSDGISIIKIRYVDEKEYFINELVDYLVENFNAIVIAINETHDKATFILNSTKKLHEIHTYINLGKDVINLSKKYEIKGGGNEFAARGIIKNKKDIDIFIENVYHNYVNK